MIDETRLNEIQNTLAAANNQGDEGAVRKLLRVHLPWLLNEARRINLVSAPEQEEPAEDSELEEFNVADMNIVDVLAVVESGELDPADALDQELARPEDEQRSTLIAQLSTVVESE